MKESDILGVLDRRPRRQEEGRLITAVRPSPWERRQALRGEHVTINFRETKYVSQRSQIRR